MKFTDFDFHEDLLKGLDFMQFEKATPIQEQAIPQILDGKDMLACAQTGTGKTAAFMLPVLNHLAKNRRKKPAVLVVVPTRELAVQIDQQVQGFSYFVDTSSFPVYGGGDGESFEQQKRALTGDTNIIVATPGKLISHLNMGYVDFKGIEYLILDEADRMMDMGFFEDIQKIIGYLPEKRQNLLFSATMPSKIRQLSKEIMNDPYEISIAISKPAEGVMQIVHLCHNSQKTKQVKKLIDGKDELKSVIIFTSTKAKVFDIVRGLRSKEYNVEGISSDLDQKEREDALLRFRSKQTKVVVATDVLSRGIDIKDINLVINYDVPNDAEDYVHRVGRTARADTTGIAVTLVNPDDMYKFKRIEDLIEREILKLPPAPELGEGPSWNPKPQKGGGRGKGGFKGKGRRR